MAETTGMKTLKVGIVGARGLSTMTGFKALPGVEVTALCDLNEELLKQKAAQHGIPHTYRIFDDMVESDLDAIIIGTPMQCHVPQAIRALEAGKHVMSEVTAGVTMDELWWLIECVEKYGKVYMMAENYCYMPAVQQVRNMAAQGLFGEPYYAEGEYLHDIKGLAVYGNGITSWRTYWQLGKRGNFYPTHSVGPVMKFFPGDHIRSISCFSSGRHTAPHLRNDDTTVTMCQLDSGKLVRIRLDCVSNRPHNMAYYSLQGTKGCYEAPRGLGDKPKVYLSDSKTDGKAQWQPLEDYAEYLPERYKNATEEQRKTGHAGGDFFIVQDFMDAIVKGTPPGIDVYEACEWTAVGLLSELSVTNGSRTIDMPKFRKNMKVEEQFTKI